MSSYDVIVVGLGGMGSAAARALAARGARVGGFERFGPAHALGASHGGSRIIRLAYFEHPSYVPLLRSAYDLWARLEADSGRGLLIRCGGLFMGAPDSEVYAGSLRAARQHGLPHEVLDADELGRRYPLFATSGDPIGGIYEEQAGIVAPEATVQAHLELSARDGAELHFGTPVREWSARGDSVTIRTDLGTHQADRLILAAGAWAPRLLHLPELPLRVERRVQMWFAPDRHHAAFAALPVWLRQRGDGLQFYGFPLRDGAVKVALHNRGVSCEPDTVDRTVSAVEVQAMREVLAGALPALTGELVKAAVCTYTLTPDEHFVLATHPDHSAVAIAAGFSGHGFKFTPVVGEVLADLALTGATAHPISLFDPARFSGEP